MNVLMQNIKNGKRSIENIPYPKVKKGFLIVENVYSAVSVGTEKMVMELSSMNYIQKAKSRPDDVKKILAKVKNEGLFNTYKSVMNRLDEPMTLGYSASGIVREKSPEISRFNVGDRVAIGGGGFVYHGEYCLVPENLAVRIPENVLMAHASMATIAAIGIQGIRISDAQPGDYVCVIGMGLLGLLTTAVLNASGCRVYGIEPDDLRKRKGMEMGAMHIFDPTDEHESIYAAAKGRGFDRVIITASTKSNEPIITAGNIARDRAVISSVGLTGLDIPRNIYYMKELDFRLSRSYGPGRYDKTYEEKGVDYPIGYVKWTEQRNMEFFIDLLENSRITVEPLITDIYEFSHAIDAYEDIIRDSSKIGVLFKYNEIKETGKTIEFNIKKHMESSVKAGIIGSGSFVSNTILPILSSIKDVHVNGICDRNGIKGANLAKKYHINYSTTDMDKLLGDNDINMIIIGSSHKTHADFIVHAMNKGKDVYCEKPPAITIDGLNSIRKAINNTGKQLYIGYNRRFSPHIKYIKKQLNNQKTLHIAYRMNAGYLPSDHWAVSRDEGGRLIGEACHIMDLMIYLTGSHISKLSIHRLNGDRRDLDFNNEASIIIEFDNGSLGSILYSALGDKSYPKEMMTIFAGGMVIEMNDYRKTEVFRKSGKRSFKTRTCSKGFRESLESLVNASLKGDDYPIPLDDIFEIEKLIDAC